MSIVNQRLVNIKKLQAEINACNNPKEAIELQRKMLDLIEETMRDKNFFKELALKKSLNNQK